jgi:hypothetical protein
MYGNFNQPKWISNEIARSQKQSEFRFRASNNFQANDELKVWVPFHLTRRWIYVASIPLSSSGSDIVGDIVCDLNFWKGNQIIESWMSLNFSNIAVRSGVLHTTPVIGLPNYSSTNGFAENSILFFPYGPGASKTHQVTPTVISMQCDAISLNCKSVTNLGVGTVNGLLAVLSNV